MSKIIRSNKNQLLSLQVAWECASLALDNAIKHLEWAERMANDEDWGIATAHLVLSLEEASKSAILAIYGLECLPLMQESLNLFISKFSKFIGQDSIDLSQFVRMFFYDHKIKHVAAFLLLLFFFMNKKYKEKQNSEIDIVFLWGVLLDLLKSSSRKQNDFLSMISWLQKADDLKKRGFYVDQSDKGSLTPKSLTKNDYEEGLNIVSTLITKLIRIRDSWNETGITRAGFANELNKHRTDVNNDVKKEIQEIFTEKEVTRLLKKADEQFDPGMFNLK